MPRKKKQPNLQPGENSPLEGHAANVGSLDHLVGQADVGIEPAPLGNLSEADKLAIMGASVDIGMTASEMLAGPLNATVDAAVADLKLPAPPEEIAMGARVATLQARVDELTKAVEKLAASIVPGLPGVITTRLAEPAFIAPAGPAEQAAYSATNFALWQDGQKQHDGIQAWRNAGSPILVPKELPAKAGRAA